MHPIRALLISPFFYPEAISTGKYNTVLAEALRDAGVQLQVIASHPLYPSWKPQLTRAGIDGIEIRRSGGRVRYPANPILRRAVLELWFAVYVIWQCLHHGRSDDVVIAVLPPNLFVAAAVKFLPSRTKVIGIVHDLQVVLGFGQEGWLKRQICRITAAIEGRSLRGCHRLIFLSRSMASKAQQLYQLDEAKIVVRYPFVTVTEPSGPKCALESLFPSGYDHVVYSGALGAKQNPRELVALFQAGAERFPRIMFHIFSDGPVFDAVREEFDNHLSQRVCFHPLVEPCDLEELYARSTVQVVPQKPGTADGCIPSKLPNLLASGCRIMAICDSGCELEQIVEQSQRGTCVHSWAPEVFVSALNDLLHRSEQNAKRSAAGIDLLMRSFSLQGVVEAILTAAPTQADARLSRLLDIEQS